MIKLIAVEGTDGSGKNTVAEWIKEEYELNGRRAEIMIHPSDRRSGQFMKFCIQGKGVKYVLSIFFFILDLLSSLIRVKSCNADAVIFVRYTMSAAYLPSRYVKIGYEFLTKLFPMPDHKIFVDIDPETAMKRIELRNEAWEMFETEDKLSSVRMKMKSISKEWEIIDNSRSLDDTKSQLVNIMKFWNDLE